MKKEDRYIVNLIRNNTDDLLNCEDYDLDYIIQTLLYHKIFIHYYEYLVNCQMFISKKEKINQIYNEFKKKRFYYNNFLFVLINLLEKNKCDYIIYKGKALETIIYDEKFVRQYKDIDIIVENIDDIKKIKELIKQNFVTRDYEENYIDYLGETKIYVFYRNEKYSVEFKNKQHFIGITEFNDTIQIELYGQKYNTLSLELMFLQLVVYYYEFTENFLMIEEVKKCRLQYAIDLYNFIKKHFNKLNIEKVKYYSEKYQLIHKIRIALLNLSYIFNDSKILDLLSEFPIESINYKYNDILDIGRIYWNENPLERFLNTDDIVQHIKKYFMGDFFIGKCNKKNYNNEMFDFTINDKNVSLFVEREFDELKFYFKNKKFFKNGTIINISLYGYRKTGEFVEPFMPVAIRKTSANYVFSRLSPSCKRKYDYNLEKELDISKENYIFIEEKNNYVSITIFLKRMPYKIRYEETLGFNVSVFQLKQNKVFEYWSLTPYYDLPYII